MEKIIQKKSKNFLFRIQKALMNAFLRITLFHLSFGITATSKKLAIMVCGRKKFWIQNFNGDIVLGKFQKRKIAQTLHRFFTFRICA